MALHLSRKHRAQLLKWAEVADDEECCGLLLGQGSSISDIRSTRNAATDPRKHFEIDPGSLIDAERNSRNGGTPVMGYFHSHPNGLARPSACDINQAADDGRCWLIVADGQITAWEPKARGGVVHGFVPIELIVEG
jgi:desampylase